MADKINVYIEYDGPAWKSFGECINPPGRDDILFGEPRGLPRDIAFFTPADDACLYVSEDPEISRRDGFCSLDDANRWVEEGASSWFVDGRKITHPDYHSHSWLSLEEWKDVLSRHPNVGSEYHAISAAMEALQAGGKKVRVVFWFDN